VIQTDTATGIETTLTLTTDYTVTGVGVEAGGNVVLVAGVLATGQELIILRSTTVTQETDYLEGDSFPAQAHENALDRLTMIAQDHIGKFARVPMIPVGDVLDMTLPRNTSGSASYIYWNAAGTGLAISPNLPSTGFALDWIDVRTYGAGTLNDAAVTAAMAANPAGGVLYF
jgi:hypothetical protein